MPHRRTYGSIVDTTFNTPMVRLTKLVPADHAAVYAKCEFFNPMASVKDRIALAMIEAAEKDGMIRHDTHIIEPTSGNTGIALAFVCAARGYRLTLTMPESMSMERRVLLRALGADLVLTPAVRRHAGCHPPRRRVVESTPNAWMPQQFENPANPDVHERTTGPEIWNDTDGKVDMIVAGVGTGGTITGVTGSSEAQKPDFKAIAVEPAASPVISGGRPAPHKIQGIGAGLRPREPRQTAAGRRRAGHERRGVRVGSASRPPRRASSAASAPERTPAPPPVAARPENKGKTIVTIGCSFGERYLEHAAVLFAGPGGG